MPETGAAVADFFATDATAATGAEAVGTGAAIGESSAGVGLAEGAGGAAAAGGGAGALSAATFDADDAALGAGMDGTAGTVSTAAGTGGLVDGTVAGGPTVTPLAGSAPTGAIGGPETTSLAGNSGLGPDALTLPGTAAPTASVPGGGTLSANTFDADDAALGQNGGLINGATNPSTADQLAAWAKANPNLAGNIVAGTLGGVGNAIGKVQAQQTAGAQAIALSRQQLQNQIDLQNATRAFIQAGSTGGAGLNLGVKPAGGILRRADGTPVFSNGLINSALIGASPTPNPA